MSRNQKTSHLFVEASVCGQSPRSRFEEQKQLLLKAVQRGVWGENRGDEQTTSVLGGASGDRAGAPSAVETGGEIMSHPKTRRGG